MSEGVTGCTGPDLSKGEHADMVSREKVIELIERLGNTVFLDRFARVIFVEEIRKL